MAEWSKATVSKIVVSLWVPRVQIPLSPPFFLPKKWRNEDASLLFTVRSTTSLKKRSFFFTSSPNTREALLVKSLHFIPLVKTFASLPCEVGLIDGL